MCVAAPKLEKSQTYFGNDLFPMKHSLLAVSRDSSAAISTINMFHCLCLEWILVVLFEGFLASSAQFLVQEMVGQNITLPCTYSTERHGITTACWGRGTCPAFGCADALVWTDGLEVTFRQSSIYQLMGNIDQGDVALTIINVTEKASGTYCCRVEIKGWNNDQKTHVEVVIEKAATESFIDSKSTWTESPLDNDSRYLPTPLKEQRKRETLSGLHIGIGMGVVLLFIIPSVILLLLKWYRPKNQKTVIFTRQAESSETGGTQHALESGIRVQENVYELN